MRFTSLDPRLTDRVILTSALTAATVAISVTAAPSQAAPAPRGALPSEAFTACESQAEADPCPITTPDDRQITGQCRMTPRQKLACMPADAPEPPRAPSN